MKPSVAILVPNNNSPLIADVVARVVSQDRFQEVKEVLVVGRDQNRLVRRAGRVRLLDNGRPLSEARARNQALAATDADLAIFLDSDCLPLRGWLAGHLDAHESMPGRLVSGSLKVNPGPYWHLVYNLSLFHGFLDSSEPGVRTSLPTFNLSFRRDLASKVGPFDETLERCSDLDWTLRARQAGFECWFSPEPRVVHRHPRLSSGAVLEACAASGRYSRSVRLRYPDLVESPFLLRFGPAIAVAAPALAALAVGRMMVRSRDTFARRWHTIPGVYATKLAWAWGAARGSRHAV